MRKQGGGKTTALVNVARSFLEAGKRVAFTSYEMNAQEIGLALTLSLCASARLTSRTPLPSFPELPGSDDLSDLFSRLKRHLATTKTIPSELAPAVAQVVELLKTKTLHVENGWASADELKSWLLSAPYDVFIIDYLQIVPPPGDAPSDGYRRVGSVVDVLRGVVNAGKKTLILGAQFNREKGEGDITQGFNPSVEQYREAADIEQLATLAVGAGWQNTDEGKRHYWKVLKHRFNGHLRDRRMYSATTEEDYRMYHLRAGGDWLPEQEWNRPQPTKAKNWMAKG